MREGYIKLYRKSLENELFLEMPFDRWRAFEYLLLNAVHSPTDIILKGEIVHLERGQTIFGENTLAKNWQWSRGKVRRFLELLETLQMIQQKGTRFGTLITIENWGLYQGEQFLDGTSDGTAENAKNGKNTKKNGTAMCVKNGTASKTFETIEITGLNGNSSTADSTANNTAHRTADSTAHGTADGTRYKNVKNVKNVKKREREIYKEKESRHKYGEYENVLLTDKDHEKLIKEFPLDYQERIERLSEYMASTGKTYKNHLATIRSWARKDKGKTAEKKQEEGRLDWIDRI